MHLKSCVVVLLHRRRADMLGRKLHMLSMDRSHNHFLLLHDTWCE